MLDLNQQLTIKVERAVLDRAQELNPLLVYAEDAELFLITISLDYLFRIFNVYDDAINNKTPVDKIVKVKCLDGKWHNITQLSLRNETKYKISFAGSVNFIASKNHAVMSQTKTLATPLKKARNVFNVSTRSYQEILNVVKVADGIDMVGSILFNEPRHYITPDGFVHYSY